MENKYKDTSLVLATIAGFLMVAAAMFFAIANTGVINNNLIGLEVVKTKILYNVSLQQSSDLNSMISINNLLAQKYSTLTVGFFAVSLILGGISILLSLPKRD
jgi:hypothetical protein